MSKKDFELIANILRTTTAVNATTRALLAEDFADALAGTNQRFNKTRFIEACKPQTY